jgi:hypothetical protein
MAQTVNAKTLWMPAAVTARLKAFWTVAVEVCQWTSRLSSCHGRSTEGGKTYCQPSIAEAEGYFLYRTLGVGASPAPRNKSLLCCRATTSSCRSMAGLQLSGKTATQSLLPLPERTRMVPASTSISLTRSETHSLPRSPEPYSSSATSLGVPTICSSTSRTSRLVSTTRKRVFRWRHRSASSQPGPVSSTSRYMKTRAFRTCDCVLADTLRWLTRSLRKRSRSWFPNSEGWRLLRKRI